MTIRDSIDHAIALSGVTRYQIARWSAVQQAKLNQFLRGDRDLRTSSVDRLCAVLNLRLCKDEGDLLVSTELLELIKDLRMQLRMAAEAHDEGAEDECRRRLDKGIGITESICMSVIDDEADHSLQPESEAQN